MLFSVTADLPGSLYRTNLDYNRLNHHNYLMIRFRIHTVMLKCSKQNA
jgi:hypothetical protein